jgi:hypothetical protein
LFGVVVAIVLLGMIGLAAALEERFLSEAERPPEPVDSIGYAELEEDRIGYAALLRLLRRMREEEKRGGDRDSKSPVTHSAR